ncbi:MAG: hypothetical protein ACI9IN_001785, partial [Porticoccaceae bacterium]
MSAFTTFETRLGGDLAPNIVCFVPTRDIRHTKSQAIKSPHYELTPK